MALSGKLALGVALCLLCACAVQAAPCPPGFDLNATGHCVDVDECSTPPPSCDVLAYCTNTEGSFACACPPGIVGDGKVCSTEAYTVHTPPPSQSFLEPYECP
ncbi:hypothetical protein T484DRAFT_1741547 [Baffinella frigidus]|nr:hypothetical protein T484DRAFT_1741547 [Cryptophyta sp. CCMP2293]